MNLDRINEHYHGDPADPATERARQRIHWICGQATGQDLLDIGCSQGIVCLILGREGFHCTGLDLEAASLAVAQEALAKEDELVQRRVKFQVGDASQLPFADESFDTVVLGEVIEHLTHPAKVLAEARRVLREGGRLIVTVPHGLNAFPDHKATYYPASLLELLHPFFQTLTIDTLGNYITYTGVKDRAYDPAASPTAALLDTYRRLEQALEAHCLQKERTLLETGTKLYAQIKTLTAQGAAQGAQIKELQGMLATRDEQIQDWESRLKQAQGEVATLREAAAQAEAAQARQRAEAAGASAALAALQQQLTGLQMENAGLRQNLAAKEEATARLRAGAANTHAALKTAEHQLTTLQTETAGLRQTLAAKEDALAQSRAEASDVSTALRAAEHQLAILQTENTGLRKDLAEKYAAWQQRLAQGETQLAAKLREREKQLQELAAKHESEWGRRAANQRVREVVRTALPDGVCVLVISKGDDDLLRLDGRVGWHFPQVAGGVYAGYHPADSAEAIAHLETLRARGAEFLLVPGSAFWWLDYYADFRRHLESQFRLLTYEEDTCVIFALSSPPAPPKGRLALAFQSKPAPTTAESKPASSPPAPAPVEAPKPTKPTNPAPLTPALSQARASVAVAVPRPPRPSPSGRLTVAGIFDEFTAACFRPECHLVTFRPDNWEEVLERTSPDLLFVESAWQGNGGSWQYKIASFQKPMGEELVDVVNWCKTRGVPTVFWNKEDPSHFSRFIHRAPLFDYVFTSDADMLPRYRETVKHDRVFALPFAAQPRIHHPILEKARAHNVCFAGAYYAWDHDERRADIDHILRPALAFGLHIYDRQHGVVGANARAYQFPDIYQPAIQGRLEYEDMVKAYKWYKVFLNVNSVKNSPTMFSRRVFELLASGTPVVSSHAKGIVEMFGRDLVHLTGSEKETQAHLEKLLGDERYWAEISVRGIREVLSRHTYAHRMAEICGRMELPCAGVALPKIEALARVGAGGDATCLAETLVRQTYRKFSLTILTRRTTPQNALEKIKSALPDIEVRVVAEGTGGAAEVAQGAGGDYVWLLNLSDYYGDNFLKDAALATLYADADVLGKHTHFEAGTAGASPKLTRPGHEFRWVNRLTPGSILAKPGKLNAEQWRALAANRNVALPDLRVLALDRFNYVRRGGSGSKALAQVTI